VIAFNGAELPVRYEGEPAGIFKECIPVVVHGGLSGDTFEGDRVEVKHSEEYVAVNSDRLDEVEPDPLRGGTRDRGQRQRRARQRRPAADARRVDVRRLRHGRSPSGRLHGDVAAGAGRYAWLGLAGAVLAVVMMQRALITRDFSLAYVQQVGSSTTPRSTTSPPCGARWRGRSCCGFVLAGFTAAIAWRFRARTAIRSSAGPSW
jgi:hypothetical protein